MTDTAPPPRVHPFKVLRASEVPEMNRLQRSFYTRRYRPAFEGGVAMELDDQYGYAVVMLHELLEGWEVHPQETIRGLRLLIDAYPRTVVWSEAGQCVADIHYLAGEWAEALEATLGHRRLVAFVGLAELLHPRAQAWEVTSWGAPSITKAGLQNLDAVADDLQSMLDVFHDEHGVSIIEHFWQRLHADEPLDQLAASLEEMVGTYYSVERIEELLGFGRDSRPYPMTAFAGFEGYERGIKAPWPWRNPYAFEGLFRAFFRRMFRESENRAREGAGLPRVGEGLVSEVRLLRELREAFPDEQLGHQVRPWWLAPQSLDIVFHKRDVAVEYQGVQHSRPVEFFGGKAAFESQQDRDAVKRVLCEQHGMRLIEVHPDYVLAEVVAAVREALSVSFNEGGATLS